MAEKRFWDLIDSKLPSRNMLYYQAVPEFEKPRKINLLVYLDILLRRKWWVLGFFAVIVLGWSLVIFLKTPIYKASTLVQITSENSGNLVGSKDAIGNLFGWEERQEFTQTQFQILKSRSLALRVIDKLNLQKHPEYKIASQADKGAPLNDQSKIVDRFMEKIDVSPERNSFLVRVSFESTSPQLAQQVTNSLVQEYIQFGMECRSQSFSSIHKWLNSELQKLQSKVEASEKQLLIFAEERDVIDPETQSDAILQKYADISKLLTKAESERMAKEAQYKQLLGQGLDSPFILTNALIVQLRQEHAAQEAKVASLRQIYLSGHPEMQVEEAKLSRLQSGLNRELKRLSLAAKSDYEAAKRTEDLLREAYKQQKDRVATLKKQTVKYKILKRDVEANEALYKGLLARMKEVSIASTSVPTNVQVIDAAELPATPHRPKKGLNLILASIFGIFGGVGLAFLVDHLDKSVKSVEELEETSRLPVLSLVPALTSSDKLVALPEPQNPKLVYLQKYNSDMAEAIRHLRTSILLTAENSPPKVLLITSPNPGEGKTTIAVNLACSLARLGLKVLLLDADLRHPHLGKVFNLPAHPGLTDFLHNGVPLEEIINSSGLADLDIIMGGTASSSPSELLSSSAFKEFLEKMRQSYSHIIVDSPPVLGCSDSLILSASVDGVVLVVRHFVTPLEASRLAQEFLQKVRAPLIGTVMNDVDFGKYGYGYYYYSNYYKDFSE